MEDSKTHINDEQVEILDSFFKDSNNYPDPCPICGFALERSGNCRRCGYCERC